MRPQRLAPLRLRTWLLATLACVGCATLGDQGQPLVPTRYQTRTGPYAVYSNFPIPADAPAIRNLQSLESDIVTSLGVRVKADEPPVEIYILNDRQAFAHFLTFYYPELPPRRAFFLAQGSRRVVYTFLGDRLDEDLRHEATHALLHVAIGDLPLWLDEGLAEYFECPEGRQGLNSEHLNRLPHDLGTGWKPDLAKLEALKSVREMAPRDYREAWAWAHYLLNGPNPVKAALLAYIADLRTTGTATPLSKRLGAVEAGTNQLMLAHLEQLRALPMATAPSSAPPTVRLQDNALEQVVVAPPHRSVLTRLRGLFGF